MSIVDPLRRRVIGSSKATSPSATPFETHLRGPENYDTPRSRDIFNVARRLEAGRPPPTPKKPSLGQRLLRTFGLGVKQEEESKPDGRIMAIDGPQGNSLSRGYQRETNPVHRKLPEEHLQAWQDRKRASAETTSSSACSSSQPKKFKGPIPRRPQLPETQHLSQTLSTAFLTPLEREIYTLMRRVGRCATFTPFTSPHSGGGEGEEDNGDDGPRRRQVMLVHPSNVAPLQYVQTLATTTLSEQEKHVVMHSLQGLLMANVLRTLKIVLFQPDVWITADSRSGRGYSPVDEDREREREKKVLRRPESWEFFTGRVNSSWEQIDPSTNKKVVLYTQGQEYKRKPSIFTHLEQREFMPDASSSEDSEDDVRIHLRGGGGGEGRAALPFGRSARVYGGYFARAGPPKPLTDEERVPRALFWLAGGRVSPRKQAPTAGEMRIRRKAEVENRKEVGLVGTLLGVRRMRRSQSQAASVSIANESPDAEAETDGSSVAGKSDEDRDADTEVLPATPQRAPLAAE